MSLKSILQSMTIAAIFSIFAVVPYNSVYAGQNDPKAAEAYEKADDAQAEKFNEQMETKGRTISYEKADDAQAEKFNEQMETKRRK